MEYKKLGQFMIHNTLAQGGMGQIILTTTSAGNRIVLKQILKDHTEDLDYLEMFYNEARLSLQLNHPNIVKAYRFGMIGKRLYLAFEYMEGQNLRGVLNVVKAKGLSVSEHLAVFITREVLKGLTYAHEKTDEAGNKLGIVHRDVNPSNIFITYAGDVKIIDFGIAKATALQGIVSTPSGSLKGKYHYMSPEQASGKPVDCRTDLYSCGVLLWELLTGRRLFPLSSAAEMLIAVQNGDIPELQIHYPNCDPELEHIVKKALAKNPRNRYQTARAFNEDLQQYLSNHWPSVNSKMLSAFTKALFYSTKPEMVQKNDPLFASYYGLTLVGAGDEEVTQKGLSFCEKALKKDVTNPELYLNLGKAYHVSGDKRKAIDLYRKGLSIDTRNGDILAEIRRMGIRKKPVIKFLSRHNPINKYLGKLRDIFLQYSQIPS